MPTLEERLAKARASTQAPQSSSAAAFGQSFSNRLLGNVANIPDVVANLGARGVNAMYNRLPDIMQPTQWGAESDWQMGDPQPQKAPLIPVPPVGQDMVPGPTGDDLMGAVQRVGESAGALRTMDFGQFRPDASEQQRQRTEKLAQESPTASLLGSISGDVMTLITARAPIGAARAEQQLASAMRFPQAVKSAPVSLAPTVAQALKRATKGSKFVNGLLNRTGRAAEAGLEGFALAALNGQADPIETAAYAAGTQAAGSLLLSGMSGLLSGGPTKAGAKLAISAAAIGGITQLIKSAAPGGNDSVLSSLETGFDKVALGLAAGIVSGGAGMGRVTKGFPVTALPWVADAITAMPRAATISVITSILEDPASEAVVGKIATDPTYFDPASLRMIERAFLDPDVDLTSTINGLMQNREFSKQFEAIGRQ